MACKTVSVLGAATQQVAIPSRLPQTQSDWQTFTQQLNTLFSQLSTTARRPASTSVPIQYATLFSSTLPPLQTTNCTVTADNSWSLFGGYSYKIAVTGPNASVVCGASGFPLPIPPNENWLLSVYGKCSGASQSFKMGLQTATTTYENTVITDATATTVDRFAIPLNLVADDASQCTLRLDFPSASGQTFWFDGFQYEPSVTGSINPSPFLSTNIIAGSIVAQFITVAQLSALSANMGTLTAGKIQSSDGRFTIDCTNELITITDGTNTRMQIGEVSAGVYDVKIWNGSGTLLFDAATGLQYAGNSTQITQVIGNNSGNGQLNVNPTGGVTSNLPQANHDPTVLLSSVTGNQRNLIPDSGLKSPGIYWPDYSGGLIVVTQNLDGHNNCFEYVGTGAASGFQYRASLPIPVNQNTTYTLSVYVSSGNITAGTAFVGVYNTAITTSYGALSISSSSSGRIHTSVTIPAGVSQVVVIFDTDNCTVSNGNGLFCQQMQLEAGSVMTAYRESTGDNLNGTLGIDFSKTIHANKTINNVGDDPAGVWLRFKGTQQTAILTNQASNHILDPGFTSIADFWGGTNSASAGVLNQGTVAASGFSNNFNYDGRGNRVKVKLNPGDTLVLQLTSTQAPTGTASTYLSAEFLTAAGAHISYSGQALVPSTGTGTGTLVVTAPATCAYANLFIQSQGNASGGNAALVTSPQARINHETVADAGAKKAYADFTDNTAGGHIGKSNWADATQMGTNIQGGTGLTDGETITFANAYFADPEIVFGDGGLTYDSTLGAVSQFQDFSASFTHSGGQTTGFTAALKISTVGGALTPHSQNFSSDSVTLSFSSGVIANGALTVSGAVANSESELNVVTITLTDTTHSQSWQKNVSVPANGTKPFGFSITDTSAASGTVFTLSYTSGAGDSGTPTLAYQTQTAATVHTATPTGVPGVNWVAFSTS